MGAATASDEQNFIAKAELRSAGEILDVADLHYRLHWALREAMQVRGVEPPASLEPGVVMERRYALAHLGR